MFRKITINVMMFVIIAAALNAGTYTDLMKLNNTNQEKIRTFLAVGQTSIAIRSGDGTPLVNQSISIQIYMKKPDLFKVTMQEPAAGAFVQKGDLITQKIGNAPASTRKVEPSSNLAKNYFGGIAVEALSESGITAQEGRTYNGEAVTAFTMQTDYTYEGATTTVAKEQLKIEKIMVFINKQGMIVKQIMYHAGELLLELTYHYIQKDDIWVADKINTKIRYKSMDMETTISYSSISLNSPIADKEFELR